MGITRNCHYCWAQFQLNVTKNMKNNHGGCSSIVQQKENGKYMQHLALHLNAPYKCNECSYPITDAKQFLKHKQFYKHDEKTCIMVDNDILGKEAVSAALKDKEKEDKGEIVPTTRRKTLIAT